MSAPSAKSLFRATKPKRRVAALQGDLANGWPEERLVLAPDTRDVLDFDPTPRDATASFLAAEAARIREIGGPVWENAVGDGRIARELVDWGFDVIGSDVVDRGWPGTDVRSFYEFREAPSQVVVTNPPYCEISARDGHGRWLAHLDALGVRYAAVLLNWDWIAARINGMDELHARWPVARAYVCCWKIDFRGGGSPPQRNGWLVWDRDWEGETVLRRLFRDAGERRQGDLI